MPDLLIRNINGKTVIAVDYCEPKRLEEVLHDGHERRIPISDEDAKLLIYELRWMLEFNMLGADRNV